MLSRLGLALLVFFQFTSGLSQTEWTPEEVESVLGGVDIQVDQALDALEKKGVTPYDFGFHLLRNGHVDKAKAWLKVIGIKTKDLKYIYGLAWMKWITGDSQGAINDVKYILARNPPALLQARTLYLLGAVSVDEFDFEVARNNLNAAIEGYKALEKLGGQYLCVTMLAKCAVFEGDFHLVEPLLERAAELNEGVKLKGKKPYSAGAHHEILSELRYAEGDYQGALTEAKNSAEAYRVGEEFHLADDVDAKIAFLLLLTGKPKDAHRLASQLWQENHDKRDRERLLAYNSITLMKLSLCSGNDQDADDKENAARTWAEAGPGGKALINLLNWAKEEKNFPCPEWR